MWQTGNEYLSTGGIRNLKEKRVGIQRRALEFRDALDRAKYHNRNHDIVRDIANHARGPGISIGENGVGGTVC